MSRPFRKNNGAKKQDLRNKGPGWVRELLRISSRYNFQNKNQMKITRTDNQVIIRGWLSRPAVTVTKGTEETKGLKGPEK